jgi:hypothetical protein
VGAATIAFFTRYAEIILRGVEPSLSIFEIGINDAGKGTDYTAFRLACAHAGNSLNRPT